LEPVTIADLNVPNVWVFQIANRTLSILSYRKGQIAELVISIFEILQIADLTVSPSFHYISNCICATSLNYAKQYGTIRISIHAAFTT